MLYTENNCDNYGYGYDHRRSSGVAKAGLATGITGAALGAMNALGGLGGAVVQGMGHNNYGGHNDVPCSENCFINRYEAGLMHENMQLTAEVAHGKLASDTDRKLLELYKYVVDENKGMQAQLSDQRVINEHNSCMISGLTDAMKRQKEEMYRLLETEAAARNEADSRIVDYANCHFVPQVICGVACDPATAYRKGTFNPFNRCGCGTPDTNVAG